MKKGNLIIEKEDSFDFHQEFTQFNFGIGYLYSDYKDKKHLFYIDFMFWHLDFIC